MIFSYWCWPVCQTSWVCSHSHISCQQVFSSHYSDIWVSTSLQIASHRNTTILIISLMSVICYFSLSFLLPTSVRKYAGTMDFPKGIVSKWHSANVSILMSICPQVLTLYLSVKQRNWVVLTLQRITRTRVCSESAAQVFSHFGACLAHHTPLGLESFLMSQLSINE